MTRMRSVPPGSFERLSSVEALWRAWRVYSSGKRRWPAVAAFSLDADRHVLSLHRALQTGTYTPGSYHQRAIREPKTRLISAPPVRERVLHQAVVTDIGPAYTRRFIHDSYACLPGRGPQRAVLRYLGWTRRYPWRLSLDIRRYFLSIHHQILIGLVRRRLRDQRTLALVSTLIEHGGQVYRTRQAVRVLGLARDPVAPGTGMPIGSLLSQWAANLYLDALDHHVKRVLKVPAYLRYMDDMTLFDRDASRLEDVRGAVVEWLSSERALALNRKRWCVMDTRLPSTYLGYRVSRAGVSPGRKMRRRMPGKLRAAATRGETALKDSVRSYQALMRLG